MKCARPHLSYQCDKDPNTPAKCCNCGLSHPANFTGCAARMRAPVREIALSRKDKGSQLLGAIALIKELLKDSDLVELIRALLPV